MNKPPAERMALSVSEFCESTTLSDRTVRGLIYRGELKARRVGTRWLIPITVAKDFLKKHHGGRNCKK